MFGSIKKFAKDRKGAFAMQFALMAVPLCVCTGLAIDGGRAFLARYELAAACDAAALALASTVEEDADLNVLAHKFVNANFHAEHNGPITLELDDVGDEEETLILKGQATIDTYFMPLVGQPSVTVGAECEVKRGGNSIEVTLALDVTGSMAGTRMDALREAAADLVDTVVSDVQPPEAPFHSRVAIVPWANNVFVGDLADDLRGPVIGPQAITGATWRNGASASSISATWRTGSQFTVSTVSKVSSRVQITVTGTPTALINGDVVGLYTPTSGFNNGGFASYRNQAYKLADRSGTSTVTFNLQDLNGNYIAPPGGTPANGTSWRVQECLNTACQMRLSGSGLGGLAADDWVHLSGFTAPYANLNYNGTTNPPRQVAGSPVAPTSTNVFLTVVGPTIGNPNSTITAATGGAIQECFNDTCAVRVTSAGHGLSDGDYVQITGVSGLTGGTPAISVSDPSNASLQVTGVTSSTYILSGTKGPSYSNYVSGGEGQCLVQGCARYRFTNMSNAVVIRPITNCVSERVVSNIATDAAPNAALLGRVYAPAAGAANTDCEPANVITPLTADKDALKAALDETTGMQIAGSTAGQIGTAWGWYMISPNWAGVFDGDFDPSPAGSERLLRFVVLMTDGEFNTAHCNGVVSANFGYSDTSHRGNCNATNGAPFTQAANLCANIKAANNGGEPPIIVYTIGFEVAPNGGADNFLRACASGDDRYYRADNPEQLKEAFDEIATSISMLRIAR